MTSVADGQQRALARVDLDYSLCSPYGRVSPNTQAKTWFFEVAAARDTDDGWADLLNRIFYDANVRLGRAEPGDVNFLNLEALRRGPVDVGAMLAGGGSSWDALPWFAAQRGVVWEGAPCFLVDAAGNYDLMSASDYTEMLMNRLLRGGRVDEATFVKFFDTLAGLVGRSPVGRLYYDDRAKRFANLTEIRPAREYRRPPGTKPYVSGPVDRGLVGG